MDIEELRRNIADALRKRLEQMGESQVALARRSGLTQGAISGWLNKRTVTKKPSLPSLYSAVNLAEALGVSLDYLATGREFWPEMNDERLKRLVLRLRKLDKRTLSALEAAIDTLIATSEPESAGSISDEEEEDQAQSPARG